MIRIEVAGVDAIKKRLLEVPKKLERRVIVEMAQIVHDEAQRRIDRHTKTGALLQSLYNRAIPGGREIGNNPARAPYAKFVHWGSRPHVIKGKPIPPRKVFPKPPNPVLGGIFRRWYVKKQKTLRWVAGSKFVFANSVNHPGYKGDPYLVNAAREAIRRMPEIVEKFSKEL